MAVKLDSQEVEESFKSLDGWSLSEDNIKKTFIFSNFVEAFAFMTKCATYAEEINHHPEWTNTYNKVEVLLTTHDVQGLSEFDFQVASFMDREPKLSLPEFIK